MMNGTTFCVCFTSAVFSNRSCSAASSQSRSEAMAKRPQEGDYDESVGAKSKPVRNLVSRSRAGISTVLSSTSSSSQANVGPEDHEVSFKACTGSSVVQNQEKNFAKGDTMANSQMRHSDASSMASTGPPVAWESNLIQNSQASTGPLVIKDFVTDIDLETKEDCNILSARPISF